jgi:hypothetical protein
MPQRRRWIIGFVLATILMWAGSWFFLDSVPVNVWDPACGGYVLAEGHEHRVWGEGRAVTPYGKHGIACIPDVSRVDGPRVAIWGDSFVAAYQVPCGDKIAQQVTLMSARAGLPVTGVAIAEPNRSANDYYVLLPDYERIVAPCLHIICLASIGDVCPDPGRPLLDPERARLRYSRAPFLAGLRGPAETFHLNFLWVLVRKILLDSSTGGVRKLRFRPGPDRSRTPEAEDEPPWAPPDEVWDSFLSSLKGQATRPIVFLYGPVLPTIRHNRIVFEDHTADTVDRFRRACERNDVGFIDVLDRFLDFYGSTGKFPAGFNNGFPSRGHWNVNGHRLAAEAVVEYLGAHRDAVLAD